jgi:hypothetical protein
VFYFLNSKKKKKKKITPKKQDVRRSQKIKNSQPGPLVDYVGPVTITTILIVTIIAQFTMKMHSFHHHKYK